MSTQQKFPDVVSTAIFCEDNSCMCVVENNTIFLPFSTLTSKTTWMQQCLKDVVELTGLELAISPFRIIKVWIPLSSNAYFIHCIFRVDIYKEMKYKLKSPSGKYSPKIRWMSEQEVFKFFSTDSMCTHTLLEMFPKLLHDRVKKTDYSLYPMEVFICEAIIEITDNIFVEGNTTYLEMLIENSGLKSSQMYFYRDFLRMCYPNFLMTPFVFCKFIIDLGMPKEQALYIFRAADVSNRKFLSFKEFMYILAIMEPITNHGGITGEVRCRYIFRDQDNIISYAEFKELIICLRKVKSLPVDAINIDREQKVYSTSINISPNKGLTLQDFLKNAGELKIRGLSQILRFPKTLKGYLQKLISLDNLDQKSFNPLVVETKKSPKIDQNFEIAAHSVHIQKSGTIINVEDIWSIRGVSSQTTLEQANITKQSRKISCDLNSQSSLCNELIKTLRGLSVFNKAKSGNRGNKKEQYVWGATNSFAYSQKLMQVCFLAKELLKREPRLLELKSPMYILGDFHGNFGDLQYFERMFWPLGPGFCPCDLLFLGDYVDRGNFSMEVVTYLFCYMLMYPEKIHLLRGNHEIRDIQKQFTFYTECKLKFGDQTGEKVWDAINEVFDVMPIAAVVDGKIFCCHGGVPPPWLCPLANTINQIPCPLDLPDLQSSLAWELMWNDPIKDKLITPELEVELKMNEGFAMNLRRGTAHVFNADGLDRFLNINGFSHVIRAHEMAMAGCNVLLKGKLLTVFSSSKYSGQNNQAACILVDAGRLRMMRLDTV